MQKRTMEKAAQRRSFIETMVLGAILTALVIILQMLGQFIRFGPFSISLVLIPIVIGAAKCGPKISTWLGLVFGIVVLLTGDAAAFLAIDILGTIVTVLLKGALCGFSAGIVYKLIAQKNQYIAVIAAAIICPIVNTGVFFIGCILFFFETIKEWGAAQGYENVAKYMFLGLAGGNFLFEFGSNIILSPTITLILNLSKSTSKKDKK